MVRLYRNWFVHNMVSHPLSEVVFWLVRPFVGLAKAESFAGVVHDHSIPEHEAGTGRG